MLFGVFLSLPAIPGQGLLTILIGIMLLNFPGKRRLEQRLVSRPKVLWAINWLRARFGRPPLVLDGVHDSMSVVRDYSAQKAATQSKATLAATWPSRLGANSAAAVELP